MICLLVFAPASLQMTADRLHIKPSLLMVHLKKQLGHMPYDLDGLVTILHNASERTVGRRIVQAYATCAHTP